MCTKVKQFRAGAWEQVLSPKSRALSKNIMKNPVTEKKLSSVVRCIDIFQTYSCNLPVGANTIHFKMECYSISQVSIIRVNVRYQWTNSFIIFTLQLCFVISERMGSMGNAFMACGVVYCIDSYNSKSTTINFAYDTKTGRSWNPNIQFTNQYGYNSMVDYNPREKVLYAWDLSLIHI